MVIVQGRSKRKATGGRYKSKPTKRLKRAGLKPILSKIGLKKLKIVRTLGGNSKSKIVQIDTINAFDPKSKKYVKAKIEKVVSNPANRHYVRRNIMTKGTLIKTDKGTVKITSRPGQESNLNGIIVE
jgi:small subunit ribosomal protein S8e